MYLKKDEAMIDLEHFVTRSVHPAAPGSCLCLLIDTKWGLLPRSVIEKSGNLAGLHFPDLQPFARSSRGSTGKGGRAAAGDRWKE